MTLRAFGPYNGILPLPTGYAVAFMRNPMAMPFLRYTQFVPAPGTQFSWFKMDPDEPVRMVDTKAFAWPYDDYRPTGKSWSSRGELVSDRIQRWDFPYTIGEQTVETWRKSGVDPERLCNRIRLNHAMLHRAVRCVEALEGFTGVNTATPQSLLGTADPLYLDEASGTETLGGGSNPNFQSIQKVFAAVHRRLHLASNGALSAGDQAVAVIPPRVALAMSYTGEMFEALKQSQFANDLLNPTLRNWRLPPRYGGFELVVEDTVRCFINQKADGTVADITVSTEKDYILTDDDIRFVIRPGGMDGTYVEDMPQLGTLTCYTLHGEAQVEAFAEPKHRLVEGHITLEDKVILTSPTTGFRLTGVLSTG